MSTNPLLNLIPEDYLRRLATAAEAGQLTITVIVSPEVIGDLGQNKPALLQLDGGGAMLLVPQAALEGAYQVKRPATGAELIAAERKRQIEVERWTPENDDKYVDGELVSAAICYLSPTDEVLFDIYWPWDTEWWKPTPEDHIRDLEKAGALVAAEIDRLKRMEK